MASEGPIAITSSYDIGGGDSAWTDPENLGDDTLYASLGFSGAIQDLTVQLINTVSEDPVGDNQAVGGDWPSSATPQTYGGPSNPWGASLDGATFKGVTGVLIRATNGGLESSSLIADFSGLFSSLPDGETVTGIEFTFTRHNPSDGDVRANGAEVTVHWAGGSASGAAIYHYRNQGMM